MLVCLDWCTQWFILMTISSTLTLKLYRIYVYNILFLIHCTDLVEITIQKRNNCLTDSNPRGLTGQNSSCRRRWYERTLLSIFISKFKPLANKSKNLYRVKHWSDNKESKNSCFLSKIIKSKTPSLMFLLTFTK